jgi:hypothetical protein
MAPSILTPGVLSPLASWLSAIGYRLLAIGYSRSVLLAIRAACYWLFAQRAICYLQFSILIL